MRYGRRKLEKRQRKIVETQMERERKRKKKENKVKVREKAKHEILQI